MEFVNSILDSIGAIARGQIGIVADKVEGALAKALPLAISFLASLLGLGGISDKIREGIEMVRKPIAKAVDFVVMGAVKGFKKLFGGAIDWVKGKYEKGKQWARTRPPPPRTGRPARPGRIKDRLTGGSKDDEAGGRGRGPDERGRTRPSAGARRRRAPSRRGADDDVGQDAEDDRGGAAESRPRPHKDCKELPAASRRPRAGGVAPGRIGAGRPDQGRPGRAEDKELEGALASLHAAQGRARRSSTASRPSQLRRCRSRDRHRSTTSTRLPASSSTRAAAHGGRAPDGQKGRPLLHGVRLGEARYNANQDRRPLRRRGNRQVPTPAHHLDQSRGPHDTMLLIPNGDPRPARAQAACCWVLNDESDDPRDMSALKTSGAPDAKDKAEPLATEEQIAAAAARSVAARSRALDHREFLAPSTAACRVEVRRTSKIPPGEGAGRRRRGHAYRVLVRSSPLDVQRTRVAAHGHRGEVRGPAPEAHAGDRARDPAREPDPQDDAAGALLGPRVRGRGRATTEDAGEPSGDHVHASPTTSRASSRAAPHRA